MHRIAFAQALKENDPSIDGKICKGNTSTPFDGGTNAKCTGAGGKCLLTTTTSSGEQKQGLDKFVTASLDGGAKNWPTTKEVATDIINLGKDEKTTVAATLAKTVDGGVVEHRHQEIGIV